MSDTITQVTSYHCNGCPIFQSRKTSDGWVVLVQWGESWHDYRYAVAFVPDFHIEEDLTAWAYAHYFTDLEKAEADFRDNF
ncbi:MAG: hypothetical protein Unbinned465contig1000_41 [Prokaryotic dsDNA virus sp.]|jgi:hypothetical protein|nr:MAG: hypothetical protein Unbinned465contig1000_41 [Prokaryotic dsDNA virus sp.]|tara:strand:+ start:9717 stop:9959 length:243 start_codon:yes stop_codon:yes gene_type:complete